MESTLTVPNSSPELADADSEGDKPPAASLELVQSFDLDRVTLHLREIFVYANTRGTLGEVARRQRIERLTEGELRQIVDSVAPYLDDIRDWQAEGPTCVELTTYLTLAEAHREIEAALLV